MMINKFRLWYRPYKHYVHLLKFKFDSIKEHFSTANGLPYRIKEIKFEYGFGIPEWGKIEDFIIEFWTGWKDKNGNDIYVNDIVITPNEGQEYAVFNPTYGARLTPLGFRKGSFTIAECELSNRTMHDFGLESDNEHIEFHQNKYRFIDFLYTFSNGARPKSIMFRGSKFNYVESNLETQDKINDYLCEEKNGDDEEIWLSDLLCDDFNWLLEEITIL